MTTKIRLTSAKIKSSWFDSNTPRHLWGVGMVPVTKKFVIFPNQSGNNMIYYTDGKRHLVCVPYSIENLHMMANDLGIKKCWFHKNHYDIPKRRIEEINAKCVLTSSKNIVRIIK